jgi:hypothetical protein
MLCVKLKGPSLFTTPPLALWYVRSDALPGIYSFRWGFFERLECRNAELTVLHGVSLWNKSSVCRNQHNITQKGLFLHFTCFSTFSFLSSPFSYLNSKLFYILYLSVLTIHNKLATFNSLELSDGFIWEGMRVKINGKGLWTSFWSISGKKTKRINKDKHLVQTETKAEVIGCA